MGAGLRSAWVDSLCPPGAAAAVAAAAALAAATTATQLFSGSFFLFVEPFLFAWRVSPLETPFLSSWT